MNYLEMMRLKRLAAIDPFADNIKERVKFPVSSVVKEELSTSPLEPPRGNTSLLDMLAAKRATPRLREYENYLSSEPDRRDHQIGKIGKLLAAVSGTIEGAFDGPGRGLNTYKNITDMPYITARDTWESKGGRLKELAELEHRGLSDEEKRLVQLENFRLKGLEELRAYLKDQKAMELSDARIEDITNRVKTQGLSVENLDGTLHVVDKIKGTTIPILKYAETTPEKRAAEDKTWFSRQTRLQSDRKTLQEDAQSHAVSQQDRSFGQQLNLESIRTMNDGELARFRSLLGREDDAIKRKLEGMTTAAQKTAFELAFQQATLDWPTLQESDPRTFMLKVRDRLKGIRDRTDRDVPTIVGDEVEVVSPSGDEGYVSKAELADALKEGYRLK